MAGDLHPLTDQQQTMLAFMGGTSDAFYLVIESFVLRSELSADRFRRALDAVVRRHEVLRSVVVADSACYRVLPHESIDAGPAPGDPERHSRHRRRAPRDGSTPRGPWNSTASSRCACGWPWSAPANRSWSSAGIILVFDGSRSWRIFYGELEQAYLDPDSLPPPKQYHETAVSGDVRDLTLDPELFRRPYQGVRELQAGATTPVGPAGSVQVKGGPDLAAALLRECGARASTPYVLAVSSFLVALGEAFGDPEVIVGTASAGRSTRAALRALGYFSNTIFVGTGGGSPEDVLRDVLGQLRRWRTSPRVQWEKVLGEYGGQDLYPIRFTFERAGTRARRPGLPMS